MKKDIKPFKVKAITIGEGAPKICMPLVGKSENDLTVDANEALLLSPDVVEWRADFYAQVQEADSLLETLEKLRKTLPDTPLLFTCRDVSEGGFAKIGAVERAALIEMVLNSGMVDLVDLELDAVKAGLGHLVSLAKKKQVGVVISNHYFTKTPSSEEMIAILREEQSVGADIAKIAVMPNDPTDLLNLLSATNTMHTEYAEIPLITMSMGAMGLASRLCGGLFGSALTFGAGRNTSAPGQLGIKELRDILSVVYA